jgi:hypothetical protein
MSKVTEAAITICALLVATVALDWLLFPEKYRARVVVELCPVQPVESTGDRAATEGV